MSRGTVQMGLDASRGDGAAVRISRWAPDLGGTWSGLVNEVNHANLAQAPQWFTAIKSAYGHAPVYLQAEDAEGRRGVLPAFFMRSPLFGSVVASMPFLDAGGPCSPSADLARSLVESLSEEAARLGAARVELRCTLELDLAVPAMKEKVGLVLPLQSDADAIWRRLDAKARNQVRKAERSGLAVEFGGAEKLEHFYHIFAVNMRDLGSPVHSRGFFTAIFDAFGDKARVGLVRKDGTPIGGLIALAFKGTLTVPWASSLRRYFSLCPNMILYWETIRTACAEGFDRFDFGRSSRNSGTYHFKRQWGALEEPLFWYAVPIVPNCGRGLSSSDRRGTILASVWRRLPTTVSRRLGPIIRRCLTQ